MKKMFQHIILFIVMYCLSNVSSFSQDCSKQDKSIKARIILVDSVALEHILIDGVIEPMYKFKVDKLIYGEYNCPFIYVSLYEDGRMIYQFNPFKNTGKEYWWGLLRTGDMHGDIPIYKHISCF